MILVGLSKNWELSDVGKGMVGKGLFENVLFILIVY